MRLTPAQKETKIAAYIQDCQQRGEAWDTLAFSYLQKDLADDNWDAQGNRLADDDRPE